jgi:hypothetical protein
VSNCLGNLEPFVPEGTALSERTHLGMALGEAGMSNHGGQENLAEALAAPCPFEVSYGLAKVIDRPPIIGLSLIGVAQTQLRLRLLDDVSAGPGEHEGALSGGDGLLNGMGNFPSRR